MYLRKMSSLALVSVVGLMMFGMTWKGSSKEATAQVFSAADQFSVTQNPNGPWSYGFTEGLGGPFTQFTVNCTSCGGTGGLFDGWFGPYFGIFPLVDTNEEARFINTLFLHPAVPNFYSVVRWTAPIKGKFDLLGVFVGVDRTTTDVHVLRNSVSLFDGQIRAQSDTSIFDLHVVVAKGDLIDFAVGVGPDGSMDFDSTGLKATITGPQGE
jgi:hypothetical protein